MKIIVVLAEKGGVGKTFTACALASAAAADGRKVALLDTDPQSTASFWSDRRSAESEFPWVVPTVSARLKRALDDANSRGVELVVIDTPAHAGAAGVEAARFADLVIVPTTIDPLALETLPKVKDMLGLAGKPKAVVYITAAPPQGQRHVGAAKFIAEQYELSVSDIILFRRADHADSGGFGLTAMEFSPTSKAAGEQKRLYAWASAQAGLPVRRQ
jgi:chromosome partitioning protein